MRRVRRPRRVSFPGSLSAADVASVFFRGTLTASRFVPDKVVPDIASPGTMASSSANSTGRHFATVALCRAMSVPSLNSAGKKSAPPWSPAANRRVPGFFKISATAQDRSRVAGAHPKRSPRRRSCTFATRRFATAVSS